MNKTELTREELYERVWSTPAIKLATELGISDVGLGKICKRMRIPKPPPGYWRRVETGQRVARPALPKAKPGDPPVAVFPGKQPEDEQALRFTLINPEIEALVRAERQEEQRILVADTLQNALPIIRKIERAYRKAKPGRYGYLLAATTSDHLDLRISHDALDRALRILDALFKALQQRKLANKAGEIRVNGEAISVGIIEKFSRDEHPDRAKPKASLLYRTPRWIYTPTGQLTLYVEATPAGRRELRDRANNQLEQQLNDAVIKILTLSEENKFEQQLREAEARRRHEAERQRQIEKRRRHEELARRQTLEQQATLWAQAESFRSFARACEQRIIALSGAIDSESPEAAWIAWAYAQADRLDPTLGKYIPDAVREFSLKDDLKPWEEETQFERWAFR